MLGTVDIYKHKTSLWYKLLNKHINNQQYVICCSIYNLYLQNLDDLLAWILLSYRFIIFRLLESFGPSVVLSNAFFVYLFISNLVELFCLSRLWFQCSLFCLFRKHPIWYLILSFLDREMLLKVSWRMLLQKF